MKKQMLLTSALLASAISLPAMAMPPPHHGGPGPGPCDCNTPSEIRALRQEIAALKLDKALNLTAEQAKTIQGIREKALKRKAEIESEKKKREPNLIKAMTAVRDELKKTGTVSPEAERNLRLARGEIDFRELEKEFGALLAEVMGVLTDEQRAALASFDPRPLSRHRGHGHPGPGHPGMMPPPPGQMDGMAPGGMPPGMMPPPPPPGGPGNAPNGMPPPPPPPGQMAGMAPGGMPPGMMPPPPHHFRDQRPMHTAAMLLSDEFAPMLKDRQK